MIKLSRGIYEKIINYVRERMPEEACGLAAGTISDSGREILEIYFLENTAHSETRFSVNPAEQLSAIRDMRAKGTKPLGNFHSHPKTEPYPSAEDLRLALDADASYIIVSPSGAIKSYRIADGKAEEEQVIILRKG